MKCIGGCSAGDSVELSTANNSSPQEVSDLPLLSPMFFQKFDVNACEKMHLSQWLDTIATLHIVSPEKRSHGKTIKSANLSESNQFIYNPNHSSFFKFSRNQSHPQLLPSTCKSRTSSL